MQPTENRVRRGRGFSGACGGLHHVYHWADSTDEIFAPYSHPEGPVPCLTTPPLASTACQPPQGASRVAHNPSFAHAVATTPAEPLGAYVILLPQRRRPSPKCRRVGFRIAVFEACSAFTARYGLRARGVPYGPFSPEASTGSLPPRPFRLLPAGTTFAGWDSHPLRLCTFARRTTSSPRGG